MTTSLYFLYFSGLSITFSLKILNLVSLPSLKGIWCSSAWKGQSVLPSSSQINEAELRLPRAMQVNAELGHRIVYRCSLPIQISQRVDELFL